MSNNRTHAAKAGLNQELQPLENFIFSGFQQRFNEVFKCPPVWVTSTDKTKTLQKLFGNTTAGATDKVPYPYAFLTLTDFTESTDRYHRKIMNMRGMRVIVGDDLKRAFRVKLNPMDFRVQVEFVTNRYEQARTFAKDWLFAKNNGWLAFNVQYGQLTVTIKVDVNGTVNLPSREADLDNIPEYTLTADATIQGFLSYATLMEEQLQTQVEITQYLQTLDPEAAFWSIRKEL